MEEPDGDWPMLLLLLLLAAWAHLGQRISGGYCGRAASSCAQVSERQARNLHERQIKIVLRSGQISGRPAGRLARWATSSGGFALEGIGLPRGLGRLNAARFGAGCSQAAVAVAVESPGQLACLLAGLFASGELAEAKPPPPPPKQAGANNLSAAIGAN